MEEIKEQMKIMYEIMSDDKLTDVIADMYWKLFQKLQAKGFTQEQSLVLLKGYGTGSKQ